MNLRQLRYFAAAVELRNVTRAAQSLHVAQPALGQHIRLLEAELGVTLLNRHSRGVTPTPAGQLLYTRANDMFVLLEQARRDVVELGQGQAGAVALGLTPSLTLLIGADLQVAFGEHQPGRHLSLWEDPSFRLALAIERKELDIALAYDIEPRAGLSLTPVLEEELIYVCRPDRAPGSCGAISVADILASELALGSCQDIGRRALARAAGRSPQQVLVKYEVQSIAAIRELVLRGSAVSVMPYGTVAHELDAGRLTSRRVAGGMLKSTLSIVSRHSPAVGAQAADEGMARIIDLAVTMTADRQGELARRL